MTKTLTDYRGYNDPHSKLALALTKSSAYVWDYTSDSPSPATKAVRLTNPTKPDDPLSFGALVQTGTQKEVGLLTIHPRSGKVAFWENIDNADALGLFAHRRAGTDGSVGLYSGETVVDIQHASQAGFVVTTSSDRVAQLQLRDAQSRPSVNVQYLHPPKTKSSSGFLGGLLGAFGGSGVMRDIVSTRVRQSYARGPVHLFIAGQHSQIQKWQLDWSEPPQLLSEWDLRQQFEESAQNQLGGSIPSMIQNVSLVDVDFRPSSHGGRSTSNKLLTLHSFSGSSWKGYFVTSVDLGKDGTSVVGRPLNISSYSASLLSPSPWKARLAVPTASSTAFIFFDKAIVTISIASMREADNKDDPSAAFQDTTYLKDDQSFHLTGPIAESLDHSKGYSSAAAMIPGTGVVRIIANEPTDSTEAVSRKPVSIQSKIEQAILYGNKPTNPLELSRRPELSSKQAEVEQAVTNISLNILKSAYTPLTRAFASVDQQIYRRMRVLESLASYIKENFPQLSRKTRWQLLWDSEKLAVARVLNNLHNEHTAEMSSGITGLPERKMLLPEMVERMDEINRSINVVEWDNVSHFGHFLIHDADQMTLLLFWVYNGTYQLAQDEDIRHSEQLIYLVRDATQIVSRAIDTALQFRKDNLWLYGFETETLEDGILKSPGSYADLPCPWTSDSSLSQNFSELVRSTQVTINEDIDANKAIEKPPSAVGRYIASENARLIFAWCRVAEERIHWCAGQPVGSEHYQDPSKPHDKFIQDLGSFLDNLPSFNQTEAGLQLAEKYQAMASLTTLVREEIVNLVGLAQLHEKGKPTDTIQMDLRRRQIKEEAEEKLAALEGRIGGYCKTFGYAFTNRYYSALVDAHNYGGLLAQGNKYKEELTEYLNAEPTRRSLAWLNDVMSEQNYAAAGKALTEQAITAETKAWNRGIELGLAKLALLAAEEANAEGAAGFATSSPLQHESPRPPFDLQQHAEKIERSSVLLHIQHQLNDRLRPVTRGALDEAAKVELLIEALRKSIEERSKKGLRGLFTNAVESLVADDILNAEMLVDVLTLMDRKAEDANFGSDVFFLALLGIHNDLDLHNARCELAIKLCWRRAMLADDWASFNNNYAAGKLADADVRQHLSDTVLYRTFLDGYKATLMREGQQPLVNGAANGESAPLAFLGDIPTPEPRECLDSGTTVDEWFLRFGENLVLAEPCASDCKTEKKLLREALDKSQLQRWWDACRMNAMEDARAALQDNN